MEGLKNRMLLFAVRQTLGRLVKDIQSDQLEKIERLENGVGFAFELSHLELDDTFINRELLGAVAEGSFTSPSSSTSPSGMVRLAHGYVNILRGSLSLSPKGKRRIEIDGLQLVFDVTPRVKCAVPTSCRRCGTGRAKGATATHLDKQKEDANRSKGPGSTADGDPEEDTMYSSLFLSDNLRHGVEKDVVVPAIYGTDFPENHTSVLRHMIDEGLEVFERTIRQLAHSVSGCIQNVNVILRIPPLGLQIVPGQEPPKGSLELLVSLEGGFELEDMCSDIESNALHKRIRFSGLHAAVYPCGQRRTTRSTDDEVEESVDLADVFLSSGRSDEFNNDVVLRFSEGRGSSQELEAFLDVKVTTKYFLLILSPTQLSRLVHVARALVGAPEGGIENTIGDRGPAAPPQVVRFTSTMKATCQYISCTLLLAEDQRGTKKVWRTLREGSKKSCSVDVLQSTVQHRVMLYRFLRHTGYYHVYVGGIMLLVQPVTASTSSMEDAFHDVFENHGGRGCSIGIGAVEVYERYPDKENAAETGNDTEHEETEMEVEREEDNSNDGTKGKRSRGDCGDTAYERLIFTTKENTENHSERRYRIAIVTRTTYPLTPSEAHRYKSNLFNESDDVTAVVIEHVLLKTSGALVLGELDAGVLWRLGSFLAQIQRIIEKNLGTKRQPKQRQKHGDMFTSSSSLAPICPMSLEDMDCFEKLVAEEQFMCLPVEQLCVEDSGQFTLETHTTTPYVFLRFFTLQLEGATVEMKFSASKPPDPDYYGPLTRRLWEHLREEGEALSVSNGTLALASVDGQPYIPLTMSVYLKMLDVSVGSEGVLEVFLGEGRLTLHDYCEGMQNSVLHCVFDTESKEPCITVQLHWPPKSYLSTDISRKAHAPFSEAYKTEEIQADKNCFIAVVANIHHVEASFHQDEFLLTLFYLDQVLEAVEKLDTLMNSQPPEGVKTKDCDIVKGVLFSGSDPPILCGDGMRCGDTNLDVVTTCVSIRLKLDEGMVSFWAPRLSSAGFSIGEPLWRCIPQRERRRIDKNYLYHHYEVVVSNVSLFAHHQACSIVANTTLHIEISDFWFKEWLCQARLAYADFPWPADHSSSPNWGGSVMLLQSYVALYNRSNNIQVTPHALWTPEKNARGCHAAAISLYRHRNVEDHTEMYDASLQLDRICVSHQAAHEGDHWLFVLLNFFSDPSAEGLNSAMAEKMNKGPLPPDSEDDDLRSDEGVPIATSASINITFLDLLLEYRPFGRYSMLVCLVPRLEMAISVPSQLKETSILWIFLGKDTLSVFLHSNFQQYLLDYDRDAGPVSLFGSSEQGISTDLKNLGFVLVLDVTQLNSVGEDCAAKKNDSANIAVFVNVTAEMQVFIEVKKLRASMFFAHDSLYYFRTLVSHFLSGLDFLYLPSPHLLVERSGSYFSHIIQGKPKKGNTGVDVYPIGSDYESHICRLLGSSALNIGAATTGCKKEDGYRGRRGSSFSDFDLIVPSDYSPPQEAVWKTSDDQQVNLTERVWHTNFLSVYGSSDGALREGMDSNLSPSFSHRARYTPRRALFDNTVTMELFLFDCDVTAHLYGGEDFIHTDVPQSYLHTIQRFGTQEENLNSKDDAELSGLWSGMNSDVELQKGRREGRRSGFLGGGRRQDEYVVGRFTGIRLQVDLSLPGRTKFMQVFFSVRDGEVVDCIEGSSVRTLLMCSLPQSLSDHNGDLVEVKWTTLLPRTATPNAGNVIVGKPEEELVIRVQPITVALHRRAMNLLPKFLDAPDNLTDENGVLDTIQVKPLFFSKIVVYPLQVTLYVQFEGQDVFSAAKGDVFELCNFLLPSLERAKVQIPLILITSCSLDRVGDRILELLRGEILKLHPLFMLCCGVQPLQLVSSVGTAGAEVMIAPLNEYRRNKRFFSAVSRALRHFLFTLVSQSLHSAAVVSQGLDNTASASIACCIPATNMQAMPRGSQPVSVLDGLRRGLAEFLEGLQLASGVATYCMGPHGSLLRLPLTLTSVMDGFLRGTIEVLYGMRNTIAPDIYEQEKKIFKGKRRKAAE